MIYHHVTREHIKVTARVYKDWDTQDGDEPTTMIWLDKVTNYGDGDETESIGFFVTRDTARELRDALNAALESTGTLPVPLGTSLGRELGARE